MTQTGFADPGHERDPLIHLAAGTLPKTYAALRRSGPLQWSEAFGGWVVTGYAELLALLGEAGYLADNPVARFDKLERRGGPALPNFRVLLSNSAFFVDPPHHDQLRAFMSQLFQGPGITKLRGPVETRVASIIKKARDEGGLDLAVAFGRDLAIFTASLFLGLRLEDCQAAAATAREVAWVFDLTPRSISRLETAERRVGELLDRFEVWVGEARAGGATPRFAGIVRLADRELKLGERDLAGLLVFLFIAAQESTAAGLPAAIVMLLEQPDLLRRLRSDPEAVPAAARELLRLVAPFQYVARIAARDATVGGQTIRAGDRVTVFLAAANRDPAAFSVPEEIDIERKAGPSLTFGFGAYRCLGAAVAQMEMEVALHALLQGPSLRVRTEEVDWDRRTRVPSMNRAWADVL